MKGITPHVAKGHNLIEDRIKDDPRQSAIKTLAIVRQRASAARCKADVYMVGDWLADAEETIDPDQSVGTLINQACNLLDKRLQELA